MLGNDLVDLKQASLDSNWRRKGYLDKICTIEEQKMIRDAKDATAVIWLLWTMKEASYKVINRLTGIRSYTPLSYVCSSLNLKGMAVTGVVTLGTQPLFIKADITEEYIHTSAVLEIELLDRLKICHFNGTAGYIDHFNRSSPGYVLWKNDDGLPLVSCIRTSGIAAASVSHHGRYTAILYAEPDC